MIGIITGLFLSITLVSPLKNFQINDLEKYWNDIQTDGQCYIDEGTEMANAALSDIITERTEAYISNEATRLGAQLNVEVKLSDCYPPEPYQVVITGAVSPYQKQVMSHYISENIGIQQEQQIWK